MNDAAACLVSQPWCSTSSHNTKLIRDWFAKRPRWHTHFTPTSASWINQVERFFALLGEQQIKRGGPSSGHFSRTRRVCPVS
jgi:hypothetical protein